MACGPEEGSTSLDKASSGGKSLAAKTCYTYIPHVVLALFMRPEEESTRLDKASSRRQITVFLSLLLYLFSTCSFPVYKPLK